MRIDRIRIKNFCGVAETEVRFAPKGVTIVHGPNEAGKSTLMQGINVLFDHRDDSKKEEVRLTKPVHRDLGSEVEADVEIDSFRFTYFKRFHKDRETRLTIHTPKPESLTGREAHERVQKILSSSLDTNLWKALRIVQGQNLEMPELHSQPALAHALDRVAGQAKSGEREEGLYDAVRSEYLLYFTNTGKEREDPVGRARIQAATTLNFEQELQRQLRNLDEDITRFAILAKTTESLSNKLPCLEEAQKKAQEAWDIISRLSDNVNRCNSDHQLAVQILASAKNSVQHRSELREATQDAHKKIEGAEANEVDSTRNLAIAKDSLESAIRARESAKIALNQAEHEEKLRRRDHAFLTEEFNLVLLKERLQHVNAADAAASAASNVINSTVITEQLRTLIRESELKLETARGILNAASPQLRIKALQRVSVVINGEDTTLDAGAECSMPVAESISAVIGESVNIQVDPGTSAETLKQNLIEAEQALTKVCGTARVSNPSEAESIWLALQDAKRTVEERDRVIKQHLRDLTRHELEALVQSTHAKVSTYSGNRESALPLPINVEDARRLLDAAEKAVTQTRKIYQDAEEVFTQVSERHTKLRATHAANVALLEQAKKDSALAMTRLDEQRKISSDDDLANIQTKAEDEVKRLLASLRTAEANLGSSDPQTTKTILETSKTAYQKAQEHHAAQERELLQLRTRLDLLGEQGLAEALTESQRLAFETKDALTRLLRRVKAAKLLFETLLSEREAMRRSYVAPLCEGVERLGRHVFGQSLRVEIDESLRVTSRTIDGVTVALEQLSTGAREQMGLLVRLATALIVSKDGRVPLVLDDALGSTDEARLEAMGVVVRIASQDTQTIILTCAPERYLHVGAAEMIKL